MEANLLTEVCDMKQQHVNCHNAKTQLLMFEVILNPEIIFTSFWSNNPLLNNKERDRQSDKKQGHKTEWVCVDLHFCSYQNKSVGRLQYYMPETNAWKNYLFINFSERQENAKWFYWLIKDIKYFSFIFTVCQWPVYLGRPVYANYTHVISRWRNGVRTFFTKRTISLNFMTVFVVGKFRWQNLRTFPFFAYHSRNDIKVHIFCIHLFHNVTFKNLQISGSYF